MSTGAWFPDDLNVEGRTFRRARWRQPYAGVIEQYREAVPRNSGHLKVFADGRWVVDHADQYNPDMGYPIQHLLYDHPAGQTALALLPYAGVAGAVYWGGWPLVALVTLWEGYWWTRRANRRAVMYRAAQAQAQRDGVPLVVVGAPDHGATPGPGCGDLAVDVLPSGCPRSLIADITKPLPLPDNSAVVFVSCVLEYVDDLDAAMRELWRVSGGRLYITRVEPWTLAAHLYPGAKRTLPGWFESPKGFVS